MGAFSFMPDPTADAFTPEQFMEQAYDQPFAKTDAFIAAGTSAVLESADLGTNIRNLAIPEGRINTIEKRALSRNPAGIMLEPYLRKPMNWLLGSFGRETDEQLRARGEEPMTAEQYKASPSYRARVPYDDAMTARRAAVLAQFDDARSVREEMARKAPWWVNLSGTAAGGALSPTNYIPVFGEAAAGASIGARVIRSSADAAANVGVAGLLSAPTRAQYGDDVSFQAQVSQIAMGAALGGAFGAVGGVLHGRALAREARAAAIKADVESRLATVRTGQDAMATIAEAVEHLKNDGEINLGEGSLDRIDDLQTRMADAIPEAAVRQTERDKLALSPEDYEKGIDQRARALAPELYAKVDQLETSIASARQTLSELDARRKAIVSPEKAMLADRIAQLENELQGLTGKRKSSPRAKELRETIASMKGSVEDTKGQALDRAASDKVMLRMRLNELTQDRARLGPDVNAARTKATAEADAIGMRIANAEDIAAAQHPDAAALRKQAADIEKGLETSRNALEIEHNQKVAQTLRSEADAIDAKVATSVRLPPSVVATKPRPETAPAEAVKASKEISKPDTPKAMAHAFGVDPETGAIPEDFELKQIEREGRLKPGSEDARAMQTANDNFDTAKSWGEALRAAAACLI